MIELLIINALAIIGFHIATEEGMILSFIEPLTGWMPEKLLKPLYTCPYCMSSVHSTYVFIPLILKGVYSWADYPVYILSLCGTVAILYNVATYLRGLNA